MTRKGDFVLRQIADEYVLIPYGATAEKMNQVLTLSETAAFIYEQTVDAVSAKEIAKRLGKAYDSAGGRKRSAGNIPKLWYPGACLKNLRKRRGSV